MKNIAFAAPSWIRTPAEREIVLETLQTLQSYNLPIIIADAGSSEDDKKAIQNFTNVSFFEETQGLGKQIIKAQTEAANHADFIFYVQSDKPDFAKDVVPRMLSYYDTLENKGLLIPSRTSESMRTYPPFQKEQETFLNFFISDYMNVKEDYFAGPKIIPKSLIAYTDNIKGDIGWGVEAYYYVLAKRLGMPFDFLSCFITAPQDIENEQKTKMYRLLITKWQIDGLFQAHALAL